MISESLNLVCVWGGAILPPEPQFIIHSSQEWKKKGSTWSLNEVPAEVTQ